jgi:hypothetical protein
MWCGYRGTRAGIALGESIEVKRTGRQSMIIKGVVNQSREVREIMALYPQYFKVSHFCC